MKSIVFVDAGILRLPITSRKFGLPTCQRFDWRKFMDWLNKINGEKISDCFYYDGKQDNQNESHEKFLKFLQYDLKIKLQLSPMKSMTTVCMECNKPSIAPIQCGVDVAIAVGMIRLAPNIDRILLVSGDGDLLPAIEECRVAHGVRTTVIGWREGIARDILSVAGEVIFLEDHKDQLVGEIGPYYNGVSSI